MPADKTTMHTAHSAYRYRCYKSMTLGEFLGKASSQESGTEVY